MAELTIEDLRQLLLRAANAVDEGWGAIGETLVRDINEAASYVGDCYMTAGEVTFRRRPETSREVIDGIKRGHEPIMLPDLARPVTYDYDNQAWVIGGKYVRCAHPEGMNCRCYGRLHEGEVAK